MVPYFIVTFQVINRVLSPLLLLQGVLIISASHDKYINTGCTANSDCGLNTHLQCINNYCQCDSLTQIYDGSAHKCLLLLGQQCQTPTDRREPSYQDEQSSPIKCVPHADCSIPSSVCRCRIGYRASEDFLCKPDFGSPCYTNEDCDDALGLACVQSICQCHNTTLSYEGQFGCIDPKSPEFNEMMHLLNQTQTLLKENNLELKDMFNDLGLQNGPNAVSIFENILSERQFQDTYNTNDLQFAAQNQNNQQADGGGFNLGQLLSLFQTLQSIFGRNNNNNNNNNGGGRGGFFRNLFGGGNNNQGGYPDASTTTAAPAGGYGPPGQPEMGQRMGLLNSFLNLFNQMIPIVRQLKMRYNPIRFFQNLLNRFSPPTTTAAPPPPAESQSIQQLPPTVIQSSGNYQSNPLFTNQQSGSGGSQGAGSLRFLMRTRERFRNFLRGNQGSQGGYDSPPGTSYGAPAAAPPAAAPPAEGEAGAGSAQHFVNQPALPNRSAFHGQQQQLNQPQYNTINVGGQPALPPVLSPDQRQQTFTNNHNDGSLPRPATFTSGVHPNHQSFFPGQTQQQVPQQQTVPQTPSPQLAHLYQHQSPLQQYQHNQQQQQQQQQQHHFQQNNHNLNHNNHFNAQATSPHPNHQSTFANQASRPQQQLHHQPSNQLHQPQQHQHFNINHNNNHHQHQNAHNDHNNNGLTVDNNLNILPVVHSTISSPPPIPPFKLPPIKTPASTLESLKQNFILSEADDPHPGFTPLSTSSSPEAFVTPGSFRTSARFERIGQDDQAATAAQNWRDSF